MAALHWAHRKNILSSLDGQDFFYAWAAKDPKTAIEAAIKLDASEHSSWTQMVLSLWIRKNPLAAYTWVNSLPKSVVKKALLMESIPELANIKPELAVRNVLAPPLDMDRAFLINKVIIGWTQKDALAAQRWTDSLSDTRERTMARFALLQTWSFMDYKRASTYASALADGPERTTALHSRQISAAVSEKRQ